MKATNDSPVLGKHLAVPGSNRKCGNVRHRPPIGGGNPAKRSIVAIRGTFGLLLEWAGNITHRGGDTDYYVSESH